MAGSLSSSILSTARSVSGSVPTTRAFAVRWSLRLTSMLSAPSITWLLVRMKPFGLTITPLPRPTCGSLGAWSPKKNRNQGSCACALREPALLAVMLTTAAEAVLAAALRLPGALLGRLPEAASMTVMPAPDRPPSQPGLRVATTK